jgi:hypothetical protein
MIKGLKITGASILVGLGTLFLAAALYAPFDSSSSYQKRLDGGVACLVFGVPMVAWGGWIFRGLGRDKQKALSDRLNATFAKLLADNRGQITLLGFALEAGLDGTAAKAYLDDRAKEYNANFDVDEEGNLTYRFHI